MAPPPAGWLSASARYAVAGRRWENPAAPNGELTVGAGVVYADPFLDGSAGGLLLLLGVGSALGRAASPHVVSHLRLIAAWGLADDFGERFWTRFCDRS